MNKHYRTHEYILNELNTNIFKRLNDYILN